MTMLPMTTTSDDPVADGKMTRWLVVGEGLSLDEAMRAMSAHAQAHGAGHIVGVRIVSSITIDVGSSISSFVAYGTAVRAPSG